MNKTEEIEYYRKEITYYEEKLAGYEKQAKVSEIFKGFLAYFLGSVFITGFIFQLLDLLMGIDPPTILVWFFILVIFFTLCKIANPFWVRFYNIGLRDDTENKIQDLYRKIRELES